MKILVVLGDGGHTAEMIALLALLGSSYDYSYLISDLDRISESKIQHRGPVYRVPVPLGKYPRDRGLFQVLRAALSQLPLILRLRPDVLLSSGPGIVIPAAVFARLLGATIIFVETGSRITRLSQTGRLMYHLADLFFVQWEGLTEHYPRSIYAGRLL